jgi:hypothetical protein
MLNAADTSWPRFTADTSPSGRTPGEVAGAWSRFGALPPREPDPQPSPVWPGTGSPETPPPFPAEYLPPKTPDAPTVPVWRSQTPAASTALVALRHSPEVALSDVVRAARKSLPAVAVAAIVTAGALRWLRRG